MLISGPAGGFGALQTVPGMPGISAQAAAHTFAPVPGMHPAYPATVAPIVPPTQAQQTAKNMLETYVFIVRGTDGNEMGPGQQRQAGAVFNRIVANLTARKFPALTQADAVYFDKVIRSKSY